MTSGSETAGSSGDAPADSHPPLRLAVLVLVGLVVARAVVHLALGPGFVGDDWSLAGAMQLDGHQGRFILESRPGTYLVFTTVYGIGRMHPVVVFLQVTALYLLVVLLLHALLRRFVRPSTALAVTAVWVILPTHTTITVWGATTNSLIGMILALVGLLLLSQGRWVPATIAMVASVLSYELSTPILLLATLVVPGSWQRTPARRPVPWAARVVALALVTLTALWSATHSVYDEELSLLVPDPVVYASAHFGSGLFASASTPGVLRFGVLALVLATTVAAVAAWLRGERDREAGPALVLDGLVLMALGAWIAVVLPIGSHGVVDRLYAVSTIGSAFVLVGLHRYLRARQRALAVGAAAVLLACCVAGTFVALRSWSDAGADAVALMRHLEQEYPDAASRRFVVGPEPVYRNGVAGVTAGHDKWTGWAWFGTRDGLVRVAGAGDEPGDGETVVRWDDVLGSP